MTANGLLPADPRLIQAALQAGPVPRNVPRSAPLHTGHCLTVDRLVTHSQDKRRLGQAYSVQVIDMESYSLAQAAAQRNIPFLALRVISDDVRQDLPPYDTYLHPDGRLYWPAALRRWITHPGDLLHLLRMAYQTRRAQHKLAVWLPGIIPLISPQP